MSRLYTTREQRRKHASGAESSHRGDVGSSSRDVEFLFYLFNFVSRSRPWPSTQETYTSCLASYYTLRYTLLGETATCGFYPYILDRALRLVATVGLRLDRRSVVVDLCTLVSQHPFHTFFSSFLRTLRHSVFYSIKKRKHKLTYCRGMSRLLQAELVDRDHEGIPIHQISPTGFSLGMTEFFVF